MIKCLTLWSLPVACLSLCPSRAETLAVLDLDAKPKPGATVVWSPLFQASWDKLNQLHGGKPTRVDPPNALISRLDTFTWKQKAVMPDGGYAVFAGEATEEFVKSTAREVRKRFGVDLQVKPGAPPSGKAVIGVLVRELAFREPFFRATKTALVFKDSRGVARPVTFFGTTGEHSGTYREQVEVLHYGGHASFILRIATKRKSEDLIVFRPETPLGFREAIERVRLAATHPLAGQYGALNDGNLHDKDTVRIPYLAIDTTTDFANQLRGWRSYEAEQNPWQIGTASQFTQFELTEKGARVRVETELADMPFGIAPEEAKLVARKFVCDAPFYAFAWRRDADWPYFAAWIGGSDAMTAFPIPE